MFDKLDAYNLVANLIPGAALIYALHFYGFPTPSPESIGAFILVAFVTGVMTNRLGSLLLDPILRAKCIGFLHPKDYQSFLASEKENPKLETIVANTGLYRTFVTAGLLYLILISADWAIKSVGVPDKVVFGIFVLFGVVVSAFALRKEDNYIHERLKAGTKKSGD